MPAQPAAAGMVKRLASFAAFRCMVPPCGCAILAPARESAGGGFQMSSRREFLGKAAGLAGVAFVGCSLVGTARAQGRRTVTLRGKRMKVIDVHAHAAVPEAMELAGQKIGVGTNRPDLVLPATVTQRLADMDAQGIDMEALSINAYWYGTDRDTAKKICQIQNEKLAEICGRHPERFVAYASVALQHPDLAAAHGGGFLPSYAGRSDRGCLTVPAACPGGPHGGLKKAPTEYLKQLYYDTMVFTPEGLRHLAAEVGVSQLMVGTDYPFPWVKTAVDHVLSTPGLSDADKAAILEGNAAKLLGINVSA